MSGRPDPHEFMADEHRVIEALAEFAGSLFSVVPEVKEGGNGIHRWFVIERSDWPMRVQVYGEQFLHVDVGHRSWELGYDQEDLALVRRILRGVSEGEFHRFRRWRP